MEARLAVVLRLAANRVYELQWHLFEQLDPGLYYQL